MVAAGDTVHLISYGCFPGAFFWNQNSAHNLLRTDSIVDFAISPFARVDQKLGKDSQLIRRNAVDTEGR